MLKKKNQIGVWPLSNISNPRNKIIYESIESISKYKFIDLKASPFSAYRCRIVHLHWPERVLHHDGFYKIILLSLYLLSLKFLRIKIIQTLHNDPGYFHKDHHWINLYRRIIVPRINYFVKPSKTEACWKEIDLKALENIPLGLYPQEKKIRHIKKYDAAIIGRLTRKKNIIKQLETLNRIEFFCGSSILVSGMPESKSYERKLKKSKEKFKNLKIELKFGFVDEDDFNNLIQSSKVIISLNEYITNSGIFTKVIGLGGSVFTDSKNLINDAKSLYDCEVEKISNDYYKIFSKDTTKIEYLRINNTKVKNSIPWRYKYMFDKILNSRVIVVPIGGLGNRLRVISSCLNMGVKEIILVNLKTENLNANVEDYLDLKSSNVVKIINISIKSDKIARRLFAILCNVISLVTFKKIASKYNSKTIGNLDRLIVTCHEFKKGSISPADVMIYDENFFKKFSEDLSQPLPVNYSAMHIRHGDNKRAKKLFKIVDYEKFVDISKNKVFIATDDEKIKLHFYNKFGNNIIYSKNATNRDSRDGIKRAVCELHILRNAIDFKSSPQSSFSKIAEHLRINRG